MKRAVRKSKNRLNLLACLLKAGGRRVPDCLLRPVPITLIEAAGDGMGYPMRYRKYAQCLSILVILALAMAIQCPSITWGADRLSNPTFQKRPAGPDIQRLLDLVPRLKAAIGKLETQRAAGVSWLLSSIARDATGDIDLERTVLAYRDWKSSDDRIAERINIMNDLLKKAEAELLALRR